MREFIKKFESAILADGYVIKDIPFTTSVATDPIQNLVCNETGKHLENNNGIVIICPQDIPNNEIWYWGEYYDLENAISVLGQQVPYAGPTILSNEKVGDKYVITFDGPVTKLGAVVTGEETGDLYPIFMNNPEMGILCNITDIKIPNSVTSIENVAFSGCSNLTSVTIGNSVTSIGDRAFSGCSSLTSVSIPYGVINIGDGAFYNCTGMTSVTIPNSVTSIGESAFKGCSGLTSVICQAITPPTLGQNAWFGLGKTIPIYVPTESVDAYKAAANWSTYADRIQAIP